MHFYTTEKVTEHITRIRPFWNDACMYFVEGNDRAVLIDTGYGFGDLKGFVDGLCDKPYDVLISHGHLDHANGAGQWDKVYMSHKDIDLYHTRSSVEDRKENLRKFVPDIDSYEDAYFPPVHGDDFVDLKDGDDFDLGGVTVHTIAAPGHTKGMLVFLVKEDRTILFGDACGVFTLFVTDEATSLEEYVTSLSTLKSYEDQYDRILRQHGTCESPKSLLDEDIEIVKSILNGVDDHIPTTFSGIPCYIAREVHPNSNIRVDGREGNILYIPEKIHKV